MRFIFDDYTKVCRMQSILAPVSDYVINKRHVHRCFGINRTRLKNARVAGLICGV